jgi:hypothetical protein
MEFRMQAVRSMAIALGLAIVGAAPVFAQRAPVAVPIVGSPAAEPPPQTPAPPSAPAVNVPSPTSQAWSQSRGPRKLELSVSNGTIALDAQNVSLREVVAEWERQSGCLFVNADKLPAVPVTLQFPAGTPQTKALDSLLRALATDSTGYGYIVAPRAGQAGAAAPCGAVYILASSRPTASPIYTAPFSPAAPLVLPGSPDDEIPPVVPFPATPPPRPLPGQYPPGEPPALPGQVPPAPSTAPPASSPASGFAPVVPTAPGAGGLNQPQPPPPPPPPQGGRGGNQ